MSRLKKQSGFSLLEIMIALAILATSLLALYTAQGNSVKMGGHAERIQVASMLARQVMTEKLLEIEQGLKKGAFPDDKEEATGEFDPPFEEYRWEYQALAVTIPIAGGEGGGESPSADDDSSPRGSPDNQAPENAQRSIAQIVSKKIKESVRQINVKVIWEELGTEQSIQVTTHVAKL